MTETLAAFLAILSLWCLARFDAARTPFNAALAGGAIGLAILCRPTFLPWLALVGFAMLFVCGGPPLKSQISNLRFGNLPWRLANLAGLTIIAAAVVMPWAIRNYVVFGKPIVTTTHGGYTFLLANNSYFFYWLEHDHSQLPWSAYDLDEDLINITGGYTKIDATGKIRHLSELGRDQYHYDVAWDFIRRQPQVFVKACFFRLLQLWSPLPHKLMEDESIMRRWLRYATCAWYCGMYALAAIGVWRLRWKILQPPWMWGVLLCVAFTAVHTFYWTNLRMRAPLMPFVALVAAAGVGMTERQRERETERP